MGMGFSAITLKKQNNQMALMRIAIQNFELWVGEGEWDRFGLKRMTYNKFRKLII